MSLSVQKLTGKDKNKKSSLIIRIKIKVGQIIGEEHGEGQKYDHRVG